MDRQTSRPETNKPSRRDFFISAIAASAALYGVQRVRAKTAAPRFGLVTYLWGQDWDLPTLIQNCETAKVYGVELRTTHAHRVEPSLSAAERGEVKARFADSQVEHVGIGSNENFDNPDPEVLRAAIEATNAFTKLSHETGGSGVKVKPNSYHEGVEREKTIAQIAASLNEVGRFAADYGQEIRLEMHGQCAPATTTKAIFDQVTEKNVGVCWNSNEVDLEDGGVEANFRRVYDRFGDTLHVRELDDPNFPYQLLADLLVETRYDGWVLLEARGKPEDRVKALAEQREIWESMCAKANG